MSIAPLLLAFLSAAACTVERFELRSRPAQLPRRVVRPVPEGPPGRRAVDPRRISGQANRYRRGTRPAAALPRRRRADASSWSIVTGASSTALSGPRSAAELARFYKTAAAKARPARRLEAARRPARRSPIGRRQTRTTTRMPTIAETPEAQSRRSRARRARTHPRRPSPIPSRGRRSFGSGSSATVRRASDRARSSTARPRSR